MDSTTTGELFYEDGELHYIAPLTNDNVYIPGTLTWPPYPEPATCPYCGRCRGCGRRDTQPWYPWTVPYEPYVPYTPYWGTSYTNSDVDFHG